MLKLIYRLLTASVYLAIATRMAFVVGTSISSGQPLTLAHYFILIFSAPVLHSAYVCIKNIIRKPEPDTQLQALINVLNVGGGPRKELYPGHTRYFLLVAGLRLVLALVLCLITVTAVYFTGQIGASVPLGGVHYTGLMLGIVATVLILDKLTSLPVARVAPMRPAMGANE